MWGARKRAAGFGLILATAVATFGAQTQGGDVDLCFVPSPANPSLPEGWIPHPLGHALPVQYALTPEDGDWALRADSDSAASTLAHKLDLPPNWALSWRWKVDHSIAAADLRRKDGDDFAARVYVMFDAPEGELSLGERLGLKLERALHGVDLPSAALCYVWDNRTAVGTIVPSAYTERLRLIVLESGDGAAGQWRRETRDLAADYRVAFGTAAPRLRGIAVMSDTDNTYSRVGAWYADFRLHDSSVAAAVQHALDILEPTT